jgi:hypothetical protein
MNWAEAVEKYRLALTPIVAQILAMIGVVNNRVVERILRPTESALRRLIVIASRSLVVKPLAKRPMPKGKVIARKASGKISFPLFDKRKHFNFIAIQPANPLIVYVKTYEANPFNLFGSLNMPRRFKTEVRDKTVQLNRRLAAVTYALENLPSQARRMARWIAKRKTIDKPKFTSPMRPGRAPGYRRKSTEELDQILDNCHWLAWESLKVNTS